MKIHKISCLIAAMLLCFSICGCQKKSDMVIYKGNFISGVQLDMPESHTLANVGEYTLSIEGKHGSPLFAKNAGKKTWGVLPIDFLKKWDYEFGSPISESALFLTYYDPTYESFFTVNSSEGVAKGRMLFKEVENGVKITYFFDELKISVPVTYTLTENGLVIKVDPLEIVENKFIVISVSVAPFLCSAKNEKSEDRYLFVPSGSGAVMYTDNRGKPRTYEEEVYGEDLAREKKWNYTNSGQIHMPVFGAIDGKEGMYGMITSGAQSSSIGAYAGDEGAGYSGVYPIFNIRSYNQVQVDIGGTTGLKKFIRLADKRNPGSFEVTYGILSGEDASLAGIASAYRDYLGLGDGVKNKLLNLTMLGGFMVKRSAVGVPYTEFSKTTGLSDVKTILGQLQNAVGEPMNVRLLGFGKTGLTTDKIAGAFALNGKLGKKSELKSLAEYCAAKKSKLFFDFEAIYFISSGAGFSNRGNAAVDTTDYRVKNYLFDIALRKTDEAKKSTYLISRAALPDVIAKAARTIDKFGVSGISFSSLGEAAYSDFKFDRYYGKSGMAADVKSALKKIKDASVCTVTANDYAAVSSDFIDEIPTVSSSFISLDRDVPFYGMVFAGCKENAVSLNLSSSPRDQFLEAVKTGSGLSFVLAKDVNADAVASLYSVYICADYKNLKKSMTDYAKEYRECFNAVAGSAVRSYRETDGISKTVFENGTVVLVNQTERAAAVDGVTVQAKSFVWRAAA